MQTLQIISICCSPEYEFEYKGRKWRFEVSSYGGPWPLRLRDGVPFSRVPAMFWEAYSHWQEQTGRARQTDAVALPDK